MKPPVESFDEILATLPDRRSRSRLEPYGELIHKLLRRGRTYREVAAILIDRCHVHASISTIHDFVRRRAAAGPRRTGTAGSQRAAGNQAIQKRDNVENSGISEEIQRRIAAAKLRQTTPRRTACSFEATAQGLEEVVDEAYLRYRIRSTEYLGDKLIAAGVPIIKPSGGHAIYVDARALLSHIPPLQYPGIALVNELYVEAGVRSVEIGTVMFGLHADGTESPAAMDLVRLAIPRRVYTQSHIDYVAEAVIFVAEYKDRLRGFRIVSAPSVLRHFTARFEPR